MTLTMVDDVIHYIDSNCL